MRSLVTAGIALLALALGSPVEAARDEKPLIAVVPFTGPQSKAAEAVVVRTLRRKATLVPPASWQKSAKKLFAKTHQPDDIASVAEDVGAVVVITGVVKRDGRAWQLAVSVREGKTGRSHDKLKYPLKGPRVSADTLSLLAKEIDEAFDHTLEATNDEEPPPKRASESTHGEEVAVAPRTKPTKAKPEADANANPNPNSDDEPAPIETAPAAAPVEKAVSNRRPRWAYYFDAFVGGAISGRSFDFDPSSQPKFKSGVTGGIRVDLTLYPFAFTWRKAAGILAGLGFGVTLQKPFWLPSTAMADPTQKLPTNELEVEGGLRWRFVLYKKSPRPELMLLVGGGLHSFSIQKAADGTDVGPPDVAYKYLAVGAGFRLHFAEWASLWAQFAYHAVFDAGSVQEANEYGAGSKWGMRVGGGLDFLVWRGLKVGALAYYERYVLAFSGTGTPTPQKVASSAIDQYFGGVLVFGYMF